MSSKNNFSKRSAIALELLSILVAEKKQGEPVTEELQAITNYVTKFHNSEAAREVLVEAANELVVKSTTSNGNNGGFAPVTSFKDALSKKTSPLSSTENAAAKSKVKEDKDSGKAANVESQETKIDWDALLSQEALASMPEMEGKEILNYFGSESILRDAYKKLGLQLPKNHKNLTAEQLAEEFSILVASTESKK